MNKVVAILLAMNIFALACEEEQGIWISESCLDYEVQIRDGVERMNEMEGDEIIYIEGVSSSVSRNKQLNLNDDIDCFYCEKRATYEYGGEANLGSGDVYLYMDDYHSWAMPCIILHELGHRYLRLSHSDNEDAIMYRYINGPSCLEKTVWQ